MKQWPESLPLEGIHLWICEDILSPHLDESIDFLVQEEQDRARRYRFEKDRRRYLGGVLLQRAVLSHYLSCSPRVLSFSRNQWGKPALDRSHHSTIQFSLSRSHEGAILAVSAENELGVDLEYEFGRGRSDLSMKRQFSEAEQGFIDGASDSTKAFFEIWARKEAYIKGIGRGLSHPLEKFDVSPVEPSGERVVHDWSEGCPVDPWVVRSLELPQGDYAAAVAMNEPSPSIEFLQLDSHELMSKVQNR